MIEAVLSQPQYRNLSDADAAAALSTPSLVKRPGNVTFTTLADVWGFDRTVAFKAGLVAMHQQQADPGASAAADLAITILSGAGFEPGHLEAAKAGAAFVAAGLCTTEEVEASQYTRQYPAGGPITAEQVAAARLVMSRRAAVAVTRQQALDASLGWINQTLNTYDPASETDPPTFADFKTAVAAIE